jgi:hypothetical protein
MPVSPPAHLDHARGAGPNISVGVPESNLREGVPFRPLIHLPAPSPRGEKRNCRTLSDPRRLILAYSATPLPRSKTCTWSLAMLASNTAP